MILFGGRGASSGKSNIKLGGNNNRAIQYYDKTALFKGKTLQEAERIIRNRKNEYAIIYDEKGNVIGAYTSYRHGEVSYKSDVAKNAHILTHNHPSDGTRGIGGPFSEADLMNHFALNINQTRAVAKERNYIVKNNRALSKSKRNEYYNKISSMERRNVLEKTGEKTLKKLEKSGKKFNAKTRSSIYLGGMKKAWKKLFRNNDVTYTEQKNLKGL